MESITSSLPPGVLAALLGTPAACSLTLTLTLKQEDRMGFNPKGGESRAANTEGDLRLWHTNIETNNNPHTHRENGFLTVS